MADIRLKKISVENSQLIIQDGNVSITNTNISDSILNGALISNGGISINCTYNSISSSNGGSFTIGGGAGIMKDLYIGEGLILDSLNSTIKVNGISEYRLFLDNIINKQFYISLDGIDKSFELTEEGIYINNDTPSLNFTTGALRILGGLTINCTEESVSITNGGALTIFGGSSIVKKLFVGGGIESIQHSNIIGNLYTTTNGNIGIGVTNPSSKLSITPDSLGSKLTLGGIGDKHFGFGITDNQLNYDVNNTNDDHVFFSNSKNGDGIELVRIKGTGNVGIGTSVPMYKLDIGGSLRITSGGLLATYDCNTIGSIFTTGGNVGINTTSPYGKLHIVLNDATESGDITEYDDTYIVFGSLSSGVGIGYNSTDGGVITCLSQSNIWKDILYRADNHIFYSSGLTEVLRMTTSGNIGIGTSVPGQKLDIVGNLRITEGSLIATFNSNTVGSIITTGGNVGIGTTSPTDNLHILSNNPTLKLQTNLGNNVENCGTLLLQQTNNSGVRMRYDGRSSTEAFLIETLTTGTSNSVIVISNSFGKEGYMGIGTTSPTHKLHVNGDCFISGDISVGSLTTISGKVGINNTNPTNNLDINTDTRITDILIVEKEISSSNSSTGALIIKNGGLSIDCTENATSYTSGGAFTISGGVSINKELYVNDNINMKGIMKIENTINSTTSSSGALQVYGGVGIIKNLSVGGEIYSDKLVILNTDSASNLTTGSIITNGGITIKSSENATSSTSGGGLNIFGGMGVKKDFYIDGNEFKKGTSNYYSESNQIIQVYNSSNEKIYSFDRDYFTNTLSISRYNAGLFVEKTFEISQTGGNFIFNNTTNSTNQTTGSVIIKGGISINSTENSINGTVGGALSVYGGQSIAKDLNIGGKLYILNTDQSVDISSGSVIVHGGVGIWKNLNVNGNTTINGDLYVNGNTTSLSSTNTVLEDNIVVLNSAPSGIKDSGFIITRFQEDNDGGFGDIVNETTYIDFQIPNQSGMANNEIKLSSSANSTNDYYKNWWIKVTSGFSNNQVRKITGYDGSTKIATLSSSWTDQNPAESDNVFLYNRSYVGLVYNETDDIFVFGSTLEDPGATSVMLTDNIKVKIGDLIISGITPSNNASTGSLVLNGGLSINSTVNATSNTVGGGLTINGGGAIRKKLYVGEELYVNNINFTPNQGDQWKSSIFAANNNQISPQIITGLELDSNIWGFDMFLTARLNADNNLYANYHLRGVNKIDTWEIVKTYVGDDMGIEFYITNAGEIQYTSPNFVDFISLDFKWRMFVN